MVVRSCDDRVTVVRCRTILDSVLRRRTIIDKVVWRRRTTIAQHIVRWASTSLDVVWRRTTSHDHLRISHMHENRRKFLNITKNCQDIVRLTPDDCDVVQRRTINARWSAITLKSPIVGGRKARFAPKACERFSARFDGRQTILKHSALFNAIRLLNLFHHNTKIRERKILYSITTKLTIRATSKTHAMLTSRLVWIQLKTSKARFAPKACERFSARFDGRQTFVYAILKHSSLFKAIRLLNLFHHNTKIPERNILCSITTKLTIRATSKTHATLTSPLVRIQL